MARGITESDVYEAADALVSAGERPTVERIRAHLGTGSPNTVTRHLDSWWGGLGARLQAKRGSAAVPDAPAEVTDLASRLWETALSSARLAMEGELSAERAGLALKRDSMAMEASNFRAQAEAARVACEDAQASERAAAQRLADVQGLVDQLRATAADLEAQRDAAQAHAGQQQESLAYHLAQLHRRDDELATERRRQADYVRALEDRAHGEVDRVRQELHMAKKELQATEKLRRSSELTAAAKEAQSAAKLATARHELALAQARLEQMAGRAKKAAQPRKGKLLENPPSRPKEKKLRPLGRIPVKKP